MAEETSTIKVCPTCDNSALWASLMSHQGGDNDLATMAMLNNQNNAWNSNPFVYLVWMMMMRYMNGNGWGDGNGAENYNSRQIAALQDTLNNNHNNDVALAAINGNRDALGQLAQTFNADLGAVQTACCGIKSAIEQVGGQVGYSAESVKNAIALGDSNIVSKIQECCCSNKLLVQQMGYESQLANERSTGLLGSKIDGLQSSNQLGQFQMQSALGNQINDTRNAMVNGFAQVGYATQAQTNEIIQAANANTQRILDQMCSNSTQELRDKLAEMSQKAQTAEILAKLNGCGCNS